ncbi:lysozyme [Aquirhabdus parva]|uniref:lysozyme n=1 Tax=Aquirhabdus parva TaxID=2283318 RepID=UPI0013B37770|nr:lysozyme [Aquirhabdus parva]
MNTPKQPIIKKNWVAGLVLLAASLLATISSHEGTRYKPYYDSVGVLTVCEGITGKGVIAGKAYTRAECDALIQSRVLIAGQGVLSCVNEPINQNEYEAYTDLAYNIGTGAFCKSSIVTYLNQGNHKEACNRILLYNKAGGKVLPGLVSRRAKENKQCLTPVKKAA